MCDKGTCALACSGTQTACNGGCYDTKTDSNNCGTCGNACGSGESCTNGKCGQTCGTGSELCGSVCTDVLTDNANCGTCSAAAKSTACVAGSVCSGGKCTTTCAASLTTCTGDAGTECVDVTSDVHNCGSCGNQCAVNSVCSNKQCKSSCDAPLIACNGGCIDPTTSTQYCGATGSCGVDGGTAGTECLAASGQVCVAGSCNVVCTPGQVLCGGKGVNPQTDNTYCGASGSTCTGAMACAAGTVCTDGVCKANCDSGQIVCGGTCVNPQTDQKYCGATSPCTGVSAGTTCPAGDVCSGGSCQLTCTAGLVSCLLGVNQTCIDPSSNLNFCGATGNCANGDQGTDCTSVAAGFGPGYVCANSMCSLACTPGTINCNGTCIDPLTNNFFCGANAAVPPTSPACTIPAGPGKGVCPSGQVCSMGTCQTMCLGNEVQCPAMNGTCIDPTSDSVHCGAKGMCSSSSSASADFQGANCSATAGSTCSGSNCTCPSGDVTCALGVTMAHPAGNLTCIDPTSDNHHCGAPASSCTDNPMAPNDGMDCTTQFGNGSTCVSSHCTCPAGEVVCPPTTPGNPGTCVNPGTDNAFCGANVACTTFTPCGGIVGANCAPTNSMSGPPGTCNCPTNPADSVQEIICKVPNGTGTPTCIDPTTSNTNCGAAGTCADPFVAPNNPPDPNTEGDNCGPATLTQCGPVVTPGGTSYVCKSTCTGGGSQCNISPPINNNPPYNGNPYCANESSDNNNCGGCGIVCNDPLIDPLTSCGPDAGAPNGFGCNSTCTNGQTACPAAAAPNPTTAYCASLSTDINNCGHDAASGCGNICAPPLLCANGNCVSSCTGQDNTFCPGPPASCRDTTSDNGNCGSCGNVCATNNCISSVCCPAGDTTVCGGACSNTNTDPMNCGTCGHACPGGQVCGGGQCGTYHWTLLSTSWCSASCGAASGAYAGCAGSFICGPSTVNNAVVEDGAVGPPPADTYFGWVESFEDSSGERSFPNWTPTGPTSSCAPLDVWECSFP